MVACYRSLIQFLPKIMRLAAVLGLLALAQSGLAQSIRKPMRAKPPTFEPVTFEGVFFENPTVQLRGELLDFLRPGGIRSLASSGSHPGAKPENSLGMETLISPGSLEDLIKGSKLRLEATVSAPATFAGGGFDVARREFLLQALLFAIIEQYPGDVRWKTSAPVARESMANLAKELTTGSIANYRQAKIRLLDLGDLLNGTRLSGTPASDLVWNTLMDRANLMQMLDWAYQDHVVKFSASESTFRSNQDELKRFSQLVAVIGKVALIEGMPDSDDDDYIAFANKTVTAATQIALAVETGNAGAARTAANQVGQSCIDCHDIFR